MGDLVFNGGKKCSFTDSIDSYFDCVQRQVWYLGRKSTVRIY